MTINPSNKRITPELCGYESSDGYETPPESKYLREALLIDIKAVSEGVEARQKELARKMGDLDVTWSGPVDPGKLHKVVEGSPEARPVTPPQNPAARWWPTEEDAHEATASAPAVSAPPVTATRKRVARKKATIIK